ncbi:MAG: N-acetylmuramoyl-L-alanine amidase [Hyphomonadaceae bacterium]|nr:N-acetylmuramoyl-L-alanine amidase [Clostridia bacterium]
MKLKVTLLIIFTVVALLYYVLPHPSLPTSSTITMFQKGMKNAEVLNLQHELSTLKCFEGTFTGIYDTNTVDAVKNFQTQNKLPIDGVVDIHTFNLIADKIITLKKVVVMIDPGHGGADGGTVSGNAIEKEITLGISLKLKKLVEALGYNAQMTRETDISLTSLTQPNGISTWETRDLKARASIINKSKARVFLSIHVNSFPEATAINGASLYYSDVYPQSKGLAKAIQTSLNNITSEGFVRQARESSKVGFLLLRRATVPGVLIETGFLSNQQERDLLMTEAFRDKTAKAILDGLLASKILEN